TGLADQHGEAAHDDQPAMGAVVEHTGGRLAADHDTGRALHDDVGRTYASDDVADTRSRQALDQHGRATGSEDWPADMRDDACYHRAYMHVGQPRRRKAHPRLHVSSRPTYCRGETRRKEMPRWPWRDCWPRTIPLDIASAATVDPGIAI